MPRRTQVNKTENIEKANDFEREVVDKRFGKRANEKKKRRNRHYVKTMLRNMTDDQNLD